MIIDSGILPNQSEVKTKPLYDYEMAEHYAKCCLAQVLAERGIKATKFDWTDTHKEIFSNLVKYFNRDGSGKYNLNKGILIIGTNGNGKSLFMKSFSRFSQLSGYKSYSVVHCKKIEDEARRLGEYSRYYDHIIPKLYCFDDLGHEDAVIFFGNTIETLENIITMRENYGLLSFATSNLKPDRDYKKCEFAKKYGERFRSRMKSEFNLIKMIGKDYRK